MNAMEVTKNTDVAGVMKIYVTVDWEGLSLDDENIEAMQSFRQKFPHIPMLQLLNPVYFLREDVDKAQLARSIKSTFLPIDTQGLHLHPWKSLTQYCGVKYQYSHSFADVDENCAVGDCGYTVSLENAYAQADLSKLITCSKQIMVENGFNQPVHLSAGGWQLGPKLVAALEANQFIWDSSEIDADLLTTRWEEDSTMVNMLRKLHPNSTPLSQPYGLRQQLTEYPNNAALADYTTAEQIVTLFNNLMKANKQIMVLGFHQETAVDFLHRIEEAVPEIEKIAEANSVTIHWVSR